MSFYLVRHPQPLGTAGLCYGRRDVGVCATALADCVDSVRHELRRLSCGVARIYSSPARRCRLLAQVLAAPREPRLDPALLELDFGTWEGVPWDAVPRAELDAWAADFWRHRPGGGESAALLAERWQAWRATVRECDEDVVVVTHAGLIRVALVCSGELALADWSHAVIGYGSVRRLAHARDRA